MKVSLCLTLVALGIGGCSMAPKRSPIEQSAIQSGKPILLLSMASGSECSFGLQWVDLINMENSTVYKYSPLIGQAFLKEEEMLINNPYLKSDFDAVKANVFAYPLDPGTYSLWLRSSSGYYEKPVLGKVIEMNEGISKYIGELKWVGCSDLNLTVTDQWSRDEKKFREIYPNLDTSQVITDILIPAPNSN